LAPAQKNVLFAGFEYDRANLGMFEAQPLHRVIELDVYREIVGVELELVIGAEPAGRIDVHHQVGDLAVRLDPPMAVAARVGLDVDRFHARLVMNYHNPHGMN